jgi:hypothetical protein
VVSLDHHCPYVNNCVGRGNRRVFVLFTFSASLGCLLMALSSWQCQFLYYCPINNETAADTADSVSYYILYYIYSVLISTLLSTHTISLSLSLSLYHISYTSGGGCDSSRCNIACSLTVVVGPLV